MNKCFNCNRPERDVPLLASTFQEKPLWICPQCLPSLIHKPQAIADKLPGMNAEAADEPESEAG
jgi:hypothetical protein